MTKLELNTYNPERWTFALIKSEVRIDEAIIVYAPLSTNPCLQVSQPLPVEIVMEAMQILLNLLQSVEF